MTVPEPLPPVPAPPAKPVWGAWATIGFGAVILTVFFLIEFFVVMAFVILKIASGQAFNPSQILDLFNANLGLIVSLATVIGGAAGIGLTVVFIKIRSGAAIAEYLRLKSVSWKWVLVGLAATLGLIVLTNGLGIVFKSPQDSFTTDIYRTAV